MPNFAEQHEMFRDNALPGMVDVLAGQLGVSRESLCRLGIGWMITESCWTFPERDADGKIIGITRRFPNGKKFCIKGSKRGLTYEATQIHEGYDPSRQQWRRTTEADPCPICGKPNWCGVDNSGKEPRFVRCMRQSENAVHADRAGGYIHELIPGSFKVQRSNTSPLPSSNLPVVVVEGASDVAAAMDLGFVAVGRSNDQHTDFLADLLIGRRVAVIGENDAGAGVKGMRKAFEVLRSEVPEIVKVMPPDGIKDLRAWVSKHGLTQEGLLQAIQKGDNEPDANILETKASEYIAGRWLRATHTDGDTCTLCKSHGEWLAYNGYCYMPVEPEALRAEIYHFVKGMQVKRFVSGQCKIEPYEATRAKVSDILDAALDICHVSFDPPSWRDGRDAPLPENLAVFQNGMLDLGDPDTSELYPLSPLFFSRTSLPFGFNPHAQCPRWMEFLQEVSDGNEERIALLQEWFGYNLVPDMSLAKFMLFIGRPGTGKSTVLNVLQHILGPGQFAFTSFKQLGEQFGLHSLVGKLAAIMPDAHLSRRADAMQALEVLKNVVGGDTVSVNRKFMDVVSVQLRCRFTIAANELPRLPDNCRALERRLCLLDFPVSFTGREDRHLLEKLQVEAPGIMLWAIEGLRRLRVTGIFTDPAVVQEIRKDFSAILSPVIDFVDECCEVGDSDSFVRTQHLYDVWCLWASQRGLAPNTCSVFGQKLTNQIISVKKIRRREAGGQHYLYQGIKLTQDTINQYLKPGGSQ